MEGTMKSGNILGTEKIGRLLAKFAIPGIISMVVNALYNIIDQIFIGQGVGYLGNGATNAVFPLTTFAIACALMLGDGAASYIALMLGKKRDEDAARGAAAGITSVACVGVLLMVLYLIFLKPLCALFGATDKIMPYALDYGRIIAIGMPFSSLCVGLSGMIRADGSPKFNMAGLLTGCAINLALDPLFILVFHWGVTGAAVATILGQIANAGLNIWYVTRKFKTVKVTKETYKTCAAYVPKIAKLGVGSFISQFAVVVVIAVQNNCLVAYGAKSVYGPEIPMTALGVTMKVFNIMFSIIIGVTGGAQPILGFNYGSRRYDRVKKTFKAVVTICFTVQAIALACFQLFPSQIMSIFGTGDAMYTEFSVKCMRTFLLLMPLGAIQMTTASFFQALGKPMYSALLSLSKQIGFQVPATLILCPIIGVEGALWAGPVSDLLACSMAVLLLVRSWKKLFAEEELTTKQVSDTIADYTVENISIPDTRPLIITFGRAYGAGGRPVAKKLAAKLGIPYYDSELLVRTAKKIGVDAEYLESVDERSAEKLMLYSAVPGRGIVADEMTAIGKVAELAQREVIETIANNGSCVILGRRADQILKDKANLLRVFITMPEADRVETVCKRDSLSAEEALKTVRRIDRERADYFNAVASTKWGTADSYDLTLDLKKIGADAAVEIIENYIKVGGFLIGIPTQTED